MIFRSRKFSVTVLIIYKFIFISLLWLYSVSSEDENEETVLNRLNIPSDPHLLTQTNKLQPTIAKWDFIDDKSSTKKISLLSMVVDHHSDGSWYMPSLHEKFSVGWNRSVEKGYLTRPHACNIRFYGVGLASTLSEFEDGGTGFLIIGQSNGKFIWHGIDVEFNETSKVHCYYHTNKNHASDFIDSPKTYAISVYCPISLDQEVGLYNQRAVMQKGYFCRVLSDTKTVSYIRLRPSKFVPPPAHIRLPKEDPSEIEVEMTTNPAVDREIRIRRFNRKETRLHAVCTVQTFRNAGSGPMLYMFVMYYLRMGWSVIVYDRFGLHYDYLAEILDLHGFYYHPYTVYQLAQPSKYNMEYAKKQGFGNKYYYTMEKSWVKGYGNNKADTADQDQDKTRTYDYSRLEFSHMETILYLDADEFFFCPQEMGSLKSQREYQMYLMDRFVSQGIEEMRYSRIPYAGLAPSGINNTAEFRAHVDLTNSTQTCMREAFNRRNELDMFKCWSNASTYDDFGKSADMGSVCPYHYNHWSCSGMRGGGGSWGRNVCRCKLIRTHGKKGKKGHHEKLVFDHDNGNITAVSPIASLYMNDIDGFSTSIFSDFNISDRHILTAKYPEL